MKMDLKINQFNLNTGILGKVKNIIFSNNVWHKIQVENVKGLDRDVVLKTLMNAVHPLDFIPVNYELSGKTATFLIKNCGHAIQKLCSHNLVILNPQDPTKPFKLTIHPNYAKAADLKVNVQNDVVQVLNKRYNADTNVLNLEQFYKDPDLTEFCSLSQPKLMFYILHLSKSFTIKKLILSNNEISSLKPIEAIYNMRCLTTLDLRNNNIKDSSEIAHLKNLNIVELWLDGNPICDEYDELSYGRSMKEMIEKLEKLDGHIIYPKGFLAFRRNFLCNTAGLELVDQFLEHYFTLYDGQNRSPLDLLYHNDALFSITCNYLGYQSTSVNARLSHYKKITRNIKQISDFSKNIQFLYKGPYNIMKVLCLLPKTEHDPYTFTVDLMTYTETTAVLVVTGVFREPAESLIDVERLFGFTRTFVLLAGSNGEYCIVNEQLHVFNATSAQVLRAFKVARVQRPNIIQIPLPQNLKEQSELVEAFKVITGLNSEWSKNCLEDCQYDLKKALTLFVDLFKIDKITENAFIGSSDPPAIEVEKRNNISQHEAVVNKMPEISKLPTNISGTIGNINAQSQYKVSSNDPKLHLPTYEIPTTSTVVSPPIKDEVLDLFESISNEGLSKYSDEKSIKDEVIIIQSDTDEDDFEPKEENQRRSLLNIKFSKDSQKNEPKERFMSGDNIRIKKSEKIHMKNKIDGEAEKIKTLYSQKKFDEAQILAESILDQFGHAIYSWRAILSCYYQCDIKVARELTEMGHNRYARSQNDWKFDIILADLECRYGDMKYGEDVFEKLVNDERGFTEPVVQYLKHLCRHSRFERARSVIRRHFSIRGKYKAITDRILLMEKEFNCQLL